MPRNTDKTISLQVGATISATRVAAGLSRAALGEKLGVSDISVHGYENGRSYIDVDLLYRVADALDKPVTHFLPGYAPVEETAAESEAVEA